MPGPGRTEPQHPDGVTARDHSPAGQRAYRRIGTQPEPGRNQFVGRSRPGQGPPSGPRWLVPIDTCQDYYE